MSLDATMELTELHYFMNVAAAKSFSRGAAAAHVSPPAISKAIMKLEVELGARLFVRTTRRVVLTEAGERLRTRCRRVFDELEEARRDLEEARTAVSGELRIGAMEVFSSQLLPLALSRLVREHPRVLPSSHEMVSQRMERLILEGRLDVGFTIGIGHVKGVDYHSLGRSPGVLVCGRTHPLHARGRIGRSGLARYPFVVPRVLGMEHLPVLDQFPEATHPRVVGATFELLQMGVQLVGEGAYLGFFPEISVRRELETNRLRELKGIPLGVVFELHALTRAGVRPKRSVSLLIDSLSALLR